MKTYKFGLCAGRHDYPVDESLLPQIVKREWPTYIIEDMIEHKIPKDAEKIEVYASGLMVAMLALVAVCARRGLELIVWNFDSRWKVYNMQEVLKRN